MGLAGLEDERTVVRTTRSALRAGEPQEWKQEKSLAVVRISLDKRGHRKHVPPRASSKTPFCASRNLEDMKGRD